MFALFLVRSTLRKNVRFVSRIIPNDAVLYNPALPARLDSIPSESICDAACDEIIDAKKFLKVFYRHRDAKYRKARTDKKKIVE